MSAPVSVPPVFDTTPCLEHLEEYEDCIIDVGVNKIQYFMPAWPTLYPGLQDAKKNIQFDGQPVDIKLHDYYQKDWSYDNQPLT